MSRILPLIVGLAAVAGCAGQARYSEADNKSTIEADLRTTFTITLPGGQEPAPKPVFSPTLLDLDSVTRDDSANRRVYSFTTKVLGEGEIKIGPDFSIRVRVISASDRISRRSPQN
jgi:hypothetical protein